MISRIVVAIDGSKNVLRAVKIASDLAKLHESKLHLVHVMVSGAVPEALARMAEVEHLTGRNRSGSTGNIANVLGNLAVAQSEVDSAVAARAIHQALGERLLKNAADLARKEGASSPETVLGEGEPVRAIRGRAHAAA